ncbi:HTH-type transcriptional repressor Bm3R1 [Streptomyces sp. YIM 121038]|uniref:TetR/AcrR family transcriptional regulator n=1 Tax=Streptomyces sp. YIM 121038 TaxID=2136401 RepID=UPI001110E94A|nr:TetR/AcrR family transcriptional regulator [Streptomyces sp. YIM 121038]QCX77486.1 HTH-type transcriptional repressor Bm3R1 [Streptomyces sp. YIM 121038]
MTGTTDTPPHTAPAPVGLRQLKKRRTQQTISDTAVALFLERGFDKVSVAEVAAAAEVSKPTLFRYFPAKEDLVLHRFADHEDEAARVVTARGDRSPLTALRDHFHAGLDRHDPVTGLCDHPDVLAFHRLLYGTPSLMGRLYAYQDRAERALARALAAPAAEASLDARLAAAQILAVQRVLALENWRGIAAGERAAVLLPRARTAAGQAFAHLATGLPHYA